MGNRESSSRHSDAEEQLLDSADQCDFDTKPSDYSNETDIESKGSIQHSSETVKRTNRNGTSSSGHPRQGCFCCRSSAKLVKAARTINKSDDNKVTHSSLGRILLLTRPELCRLLFATLFLVIGTSCVLLQPLFYGRIIQISQSEDDDKMRKLNHTAVLLLFVLGIGAVANFVRGWQYTLAGERLVRRLRKDLFAKIARQDIAFYDENKTGELMNRLSSDTAVIQSALSVNISMGLRSVAELCVSIILLFVTSWRLATVMMAVVPVIMVMIIVYGGFTKRLTKSYQDALAAAADTGTESIGNARIMKSFGAEELEMRRYHLKVDNSYRQGALKAFAYGIFAAMIGFLAGFAILTVIYYGATLVMAGDMNVGNLTAFIFYTLYIAIDMAVLSGLYTEFMNAVGAGERIFRLLDTNPGIPTEGGLWPDDCRGHIEFESVDFTYPTRTDVKVLHNFNLSVRPNQSVALVGASGSGKSTVLCLLERFYDCEAGRVTIDGIDIKDIDPRWLHRNIAIVPQEPVLFSGTIYSNIAYSQSAAHPEEEEQHVTVEEVTTAGKQANAHEFIMNFPDGYNTIVGERGIRLSGGQKQRVAIARALLANPRILLLDEATSALDAESEMLVQDAINRLMYNRTVMIIAHRLSTVRDADMIAVFGNGSIESIGSHDELLSKSQTYANLVKKQLSGSGSSTSTLNALDGNS